MTACYCEVMTYTALACSYLYTMHMEAKAMPTNDTDYTAVL